MPDAVSHEENVKPGRHYIGPTHAATPTKRDARSAIATFLASLKPLQRPAFW